MIVAVALGTNRRLLTLRGLARLGGAKALLFVGALRVEDEEAIDDGVLELVPRQEVIRAACFSTVAMTE